MLLKAGSFEARTKRKTKDNSLINDLCLTDRHTVCLSVKQRSFNDTEKKEKRRKTH